MKHYFNTYPNVKVVYENSPRRGEDDGEQVGDGHGHEDEVGGGARVLLAQHDDDQDVGEEGHGQDDRHHVPVDRHGQLPRPIPRRAVDVVAVAGVPAGPQRVELN